MKVFAILFLALLTAAIPWREAKAAEPYAFRGIPLGIAIDDFHKLKHPDAQKHPKSRPICTGDKEAQHAYGGIGVRDADAKAGLRKCNFFSQRPSIFYPRTLEWDSDNFLLGDATVLAYFSFFPDPSSGIYRLFDIYVPTETHNFERLLPLYVERFGKPLILENRPVQNAFGAKFDNIEASWANGDFQISAVQRAGSLDRAVIDYTFVLIDKAYREKLREVTGRLSDKL